MEDIVNYINQFESVEYKESLYNLYNRFIKYSELPQSSMYSVVNSIIPKKYKKVLDNITQAVQNNISFIVKVKDYVTASKFSSLLLDRIFLDSCMQDLCLKSVIYVDTNLLLSDYKKCMDNSSTDDTTELSHSFNLLNNKIYTADYVIWNRFLLTTSNYDIGKIYNLLLDRYRKGLANLFFIDGNEQQILDKYSIETYNLMNSTHIQDCSLDSIKFKEKENMLQW